MRQSPTPTTLPPLHTLSGPHETDDGTDIDAHLEVLYAEMIIIVEKSEQQNALSAAAAHWKAAQTCHRFITTPARD